MMKKSNILITLTVLIILSSITAYNFKLKAMFENKSYKNRFSDMKFTPASEVSKVYLTIDSVVDVEIERGDKEGVWIDPLLKEKTRLVVRGAILDLSVKRPEGLRSGTKIIILTKGLTELKLKYNPMKAGDSYHRGEVTVRDYQTKHLNLLSLGKVNVSFVKMSIDTLSAVVGRDWTDVGELHLANSTQVLNANYSIGINAELRVRGERKISYK